MSRRRRDERGATAAFVAILLTVFLLCAALAVDIGLQRVARADAQSIADIVALDLARELDGRTVRQLQDAGVRTGGSVTEASVERNQDVIGFDDFRPALVVELGEFENDAFVDRTSEDGFIPTAVRVLATTEVGFAFGGITDVASGSANREAIATADKSACFRLGSFVASLDSKQSALLNPILSALFGSTVNLTAVGYQGLADADVSLAELVEVGGLGVGSVDELLALENVSVATLFVAAAKVLEKQGGHTAQVDLLNALSTKAGGMTIDIADLVEAAPGTQSALEAHVNVLDLITTSALVANDDHAVAIPDLQVLAPRFGAVNATLTVIEPPRTKCGPIGTTNETAQVRLDFEVHLNAQQLSIPELGSSLTLDETTVTVSLDVGKAIAELKDVVCNTTTGDPEKLLVDLKSALLGKLSLNADLGVHGRIDPLGGSSLLGSILQLLNLNSLLKPPYLTIDTSLALYAGFPAVSTYDKLNIEVPIPGAYTTPAAGGTGELLPTTTSVTPDPSTDVVLHYWDGLLLLGGWKEMHLTDPLNAVYAAVVNPLVSTVLGSILNPLVATLQDAVLEPLLQLMGVQVAGADIFAVPTPTCGRPRLVD